MDLSPVLIETELDMQPKVLSICSICQKSVGVITLAGREVLDMHLNPEQFSCTGSYASTDLTYLT